MPKMVIFPLTMAIKPKYKYGKPQGYGFWHNLSNTPHRSVPKTLYIYNLVPKL